MCKVLLAARIGVAKRIHVLEKYEAKAQWGTSICGRWAGLVSPPAATDGRVTCRDCVVAMTGPGTRSWEIEYNCAK